MRTHHSTSITVQRDTPLEDLLNALEMYPKDARVTLSYTPPDRFTTEIMEIKLFWFTGKDDR